MYNTVSGASPSEGTVTERSGSQNVEPFTVFWTWNATDRRNPYERAERNKHSSRHARNLRQQNSSKSTKMATVITRKENLNYKLIQGWFRSKWTRGLRLGSAATRLLGLRVRIPPEHVWLSLVSVMCCKVEVSASSCSFVQRSPTECGVCECEASIMWKPWPTRGCCATGGVIGNSANN
jgi:hypothetical protein